MNVRLALASICLTAVALPAAAEAGPARPVCQLVTDPAGDVADLPGDSLDVISADVASDGRTLTGVIRVKKYDEVSLDSALGRVYTIAFKGAGLSEMYLVARNNAKAARDSGGLVPNNPETFGYGSGIVTRTGLGPARGVIDAVTSEIRISVSAESLRASGLGTLRKGGKISSITVDTRRARSGLPLQGMDPPLPGDQATTSRTYTVGAPSCVQVGR
jgi:hypothetical protein